MVYGMIMDSPVGELTLWEKDGKIIRIDFGKSDFCGTIKETDALALCRQELREYFRRERQVFTVPLEPEGTAFQKRVWAALREIPYGQLQSYGDVAGAIGAPKAVRAVGGANHVNPIPIIIPCHRVVSSDMRPGGYAPGLDIKIKLLELEGSFGKIRLPEK